MFVFIPLSSTADQGSKKDKTMANKFLYIPNDATQNSLLYITLVVENVWTLTLLRQRIRKRHHKTLSTFVVNSPMSPPFLTAHLLLGLSKQLLLLTGTKDLEGLFTRKTNLDF